MYLCDFANLHTDLHERLHALLGRALQVVVKGHTGSLGENNDTGRAAVLSSAKTEARRPTWNHPSSSPLAILSPGFLDQPILPTSIAGDEHTFGRRCRHSPPIATNAIVTDSLPLPRLALISITDRLFSVKTLRSAKSQSINDGCVARRTFIDRLRVHRSSSATVILGAQIPLTIQLPCR